MAGAKKKAALVAACLIGLSFILGGCFLYPKEEELATIELVPPVQFEYLLQPVKRRTIENRISSGALLMSPGMQSAVYPGEYGEISVINVHVGDIAQQGDILLEVENSEIRREFELVTIRLKQAELRLEQQRNGNALDRESAQLSYDLVKMDYDEIAAHYELTLVRAPRDGVILSMPNSVKVGEPVSHNAIVFRIADPEQINLIFTSGVADKFTVGQQVDITSTKLSRDYTGVVEKFGDDEAEDLAGRFYVSFPEGIPQEIMALTESVEVAVVLDSREDALTVPKAAVRTVDDRTFVNVMMDGIAVERTIVIGLSVPGYVEVLDGLAEGEEVVIR